jgi:hypothetical protein
VTDRYYTTEQLSPRQHLTPEGFLVCKGTALARTGELIYGPGETPIEPGPDGITRIERTSDEVFAQEAMASAEGKPIVNEHPSSDVTPETWKELALGHVMNVRRGEGPEGDLLLGDLFVTDKDAIAAIRDGKRELSCGYTADYDETAPGRGRQRNIIINHVALVEQGRCGPRCSIGDAKPKGASMPAPHRSRFQRWLDKARGHALIGDEQAAVKMLKEGPEVETATDSDENAMNEHHTHIHIGRGGRMGDDADENEGKGGNEAEHSIDAKVAKLEETVGGLAEAVSKIIAMLEGAAGKGAEGKSGDDAMEGEEEEMADSGKGKRKGRDSDEEGNKEIEGRLEEEAPPGSEEKAKKARDSAYLVDSFKETVALAEILAPGIRIPAFDRAAKPVDGYKTICALRKQALDLAYHQPATRSIIEAVNNGRPLKASAMTCDKVRTVFLAAAALKKNENASNLSMRSSIDPLSGGFTEPSGLHSLAELQEINDKFYQPKQ